MSTIYHYLLNSIEENYDSIKVLKNTQRGTVTLLRHKASGKRFIYRNFIGSTDVYRKLIKISTPNLPQIYEAVEAQGWAAVLEEYIQGDSLGWLLEDVLCSPAEARNIILQLCKGVWTLHSIGAVHRDIKPDNVILRGSDAVLIDFDASRIHKDEGSADTQVLGTTGYAAPEQYGFSQTDARADIYSLGVLLNVMLTGQHPSRTLADGRLGRVIEKCTMTSPAKRYENILQLMEAL